MTLKNSLKFTILILLLVSLLSFPDSYAIDACEKNPNINIDLRFSSLASFVGFEGETMQVPVIVKNNGNSEATFYLEAGIYRQGTDSAVRLSIVPLALGDFARDVNNCVNQPNVDSALISKLPAGRTATVFFKLKVPANTGGAYQVQAVAFESCFEKCGSSTSYDSVAKGFTIFDTPNVPSTATCDDGIVNQDETSTDCGGSVCPKCSVNKVCKQNPDCQSNVCTDGRCVGGPITAQPPNQAVPGEGSSNCPQGGTPCSRPATQDEIDQAKKASTGDFLLTGGIIGALAGGLWWLFGRRRK